MKIRCATVLAVAACAVVAPAAFAGAVDLSFLRLTGSGAPDIADQLCVTVAAVEGQPGRVDFTVRNVVGIASSVTDVFFSGGDLLGRATIIQSGSLFAATHTGLGSTPDGASATRAFRTMSGLLHDDPSTARPEGLDRATDLATFRFELVNGATADDVIAALTQPASGGRLQVRVVARAIDNSPRDDSFVNAPLIVPVPAAAWAGVAGLGAVAGFAWIRRRSHQRG